MRRLWQLLVLALESLVLVSAGPTPAWRTAPRRALRRRNVR
jgi:hypothetical protein